MTEPFIGSEATASGVIGLYALRSRYTAVYPDVYMRRDTELTAPMRARAAWLWSRRAAVVAGRSAAALHGAKWLDADRPGELLHSNRRPPRGIVTWSDTVADDEIVTIAGMRVTTPARTALDYARRYRLNEAVAAMDALCNATRLKPADIELLASRHAGSRFIRRARRAIDLVDGGAQSPRETWLRLLIIEAGYPRPQTQVPVYNEFGVVIAHLDLGWKHLHLGLEYEGAHHRLTREQLDYDIRRHEEIREAGWHAIRVTSMDTPAGILGRFEAEWQRRVCA